MFFQFVFGDTEYCVIIFLTLNCRALTCFLLCVAEMKSVLILTLAFLACFLLELASGSCVFKQTRVALYSCQIYPHTDQGFIKQERAKILSCGLIYRIFFPPPNIFWYIFSHDYPFRFLF